ncbi:MAG: Os1348 family NHLP clan protein, partial [Planctomycetota bacterium]
MSAEQVNQVLGRALLDEAFREGLLNNPDGALQGFDLTGQELEAIKRLTGEQFQMLDQAFRSQLRGAQADPGQAVKFFKVVLDPGSASGGEAAIPGRLKWYPTEGGEGVDFFR